ncbi:ABC transporter-like protein [Lophiostoma macrostomum CBS 122681]|uniref:ABC transporter-like protein n=1 Tax=Lophiostoma macrostomum CBS 122681 TaxID=1314788 RepID=A0A6A6SMW8_9PLEO|nr:ABC transporter-like protein [Lophiostoma macrostomum CBS 122681]
MHSPGLTLTLQILGAFAAVGAGTARPLTAILFGNLVNLYNTTDKAQLSHLKHEINARVLYLFFIFVGQWFLVCTYGILFSIAAMRYTMRLLALYLKAVVSQDIEHVSSSNAATDLSANASVIEDAMAEKLGTVLQAASTVVTAMGISFYWSWRLAIALVFVIVILVFKDVVATTITARLERRSQIIENEATALAEECFSGIPTLIALRALSKFDLRYTRILDKAQAVALRKSPVAACHLAVTYLTVLSAYALAFWYGTWLLKKGRIESGGTIVIVLISLNTGINALIQLLPLYSLVSKARAAHSTLKSVINRPPRLDPFSQSGNKFIPMYSRIEFRNVNLAYPSRPTIKALNKLNISFGAGKVTAIIGPSGCGKSSIVALLQRFYDPSAGSIRVHGESISQYNVKALRSSIRVVQQDAVLFNDSVLNNILHGLIGSPYNELSDREKRRLATKVCKDIQAHEFISQLPQGYDTVVGNRGSLVSGGQRQRIAIARAMISNPAILVFDEATSALDADSERLVQAAINRVSQGRTSIIIAHKLATIKHADRIVLMREGSVVEEGSHETLLRTSDTYVKTWMAQALVPGERVDRFRRSNHSTAGSVSTIDLEDAGDERIGRLDSPICIGSESDTIDMTQDHSMSLLKSIRYIISESRKLQYVCAANLGACFVTGAIYPSQAFLFGHEVVSFQKTPLDMVRSIDFWSLMFFVLAIVSLFSFLALGTFSTIGGIITSRGYREKYFNGLLRQPMAFFEKTANTPGLLVSCLSSHPGHLEGFVVILSSLTVTTVNLTSVATLGLIVSWRFALVAICGAVPVIALAGFLRIQFQSKRSKTLSDPLMDSAQYAAEVIGNIRTVSSFAMESEVCSMMARKMNAALQQFHRNIFITMPLFAFSHSGNILGVTFSFWYGGTLLTQHQISALHLWIVFFGIVTGSEATSEFFARATSKLSMKHGIVHARSACGLIFSVSAPIKGTENRRTDPEKPELGNTITLDRVSFAYPNVPNIPVLQDVSIKIPSKHHIAIVGPSGGGKSTIISLLERFYEPSNGHIRLSNSPLSDTDIDQYRDRVSLVSQDTQLFDGTIRDNILLGVPHGKESDETMLQAARDAHIHDFIVGLPDGYNTHCGAKGAFFSGGQRQRLAIARALVRNPTILLLDEATSSLDSENEAEVKKALRDASAGRTTVSVAHRLSTIRDADRIYVLAGGRISESGTHDDLMRERGAYWRLCQRQNLD